MDEPSEPTTTAPFRDALALGLIALVLGVALAPHVLWGPDAAALFQMVQQGTEAHWMHLLYVPIARGVLHLGTAIGLAPLRAIAGASALGTAIGIVLFHRAAAKLGATRSEALATALLTGTAPAVVFFGVLLEIQGVFVGFAALAWLAAVSLARRPDAMHVALLGLATGFAAMAHSSAHLLPILLAAFVLTRIPRELLRPGRLAGWAAVGAVAHVTPALVIAATTHLPAIENLRLSFGYANSPIIDGGLPPWHVLTHDWLLAFAPIAVTSYAALRSAAWRRTLLWLQLPLVLYLIVSWRILSTTWTQQDTEHGAYLLPFVFPFAWFTVRGLGARVAPWLAPIAMIVAVATLHGELATPPPSADPAGVVAAVDDPRGVVIVADAATADGVLLMAPDMVALRLDQLLQTPDSMVQDPARFDEQFAALQRAGRTVAFEEQVFAALDAGGLPLASHLRNTYRLERRERLGVALVIVRARD